MQKEALVVTTAAAVTWRLASDEAPYLLGDDVAPPPLAFVRVGPVTDFAERLRQAAGVPAAEVTVLQDTRYTMKGSATQGALLPADPPPRPDLRDRFSHLRPQGDRGAVRRDAVTPKTEEETSSEGSSLAETQERKGLRAFRVIQDTGFRPGGAAAPVVTHAYLDTEEEDAFAQELVAVGGRTCFVHGRCRTELDVRVVA
ncbi:MAG: hypothetical protein C4303_02375 [candidate division GAL15 bacterium]